MLLTIATTHRPALDLGYLTLGAGRFRHPDHRFEWTRQEFQDWATGIAGRFGYAVRFVAVGPEDAKVGAPTQLSVFQRSA